MKVSDPELHHTPEMHDVDYVIMDRLEEHFGSRVAFEDLGEFPDGEHFSVIHDGIEYVVVYDVEMDRIVSASKAGTLEEVQQ